MGYLNTLKLAGKLSKATHLLAMQKTELRWSSTAEMLRRYRDLKIHLANDQFTKDPSVVNYLLSHSENNQIEEILEDIEIMDSVTKFLQKK